MSVSQLIERTSSVSDAAETYVSDMPVGAGGADLPAIGAVLDERYEITGLLGQGGMGHVLSARHVVLGNRLAIKVLRREMTRDAEIVERFRREARAASAIGHSGIVAVKDFGALPSGASYYVMEHVEGQSVAEALAEARAFPLARALDVVRQMANALGAAHAAGIVHRDVKPENVLLTKTFDGHADQVKILDFGIAKLDFASRLSGAHRVLGTPAYMSPEQARGQTLDLRADVYALGMVFYELLTGDVAFDDARPLEVLRMQIMTPAPSVRLLRPDVPDAIEQLIARCLEKKQEARPASMKEIADAIETVQATMPAASVTPTPAPIPRRAAPRPKLPSISVAPITSSSPPSVPSRATPVATAPARRSHATWIAGAVLTLIGVAALAAAVGIVFGARSTPAVAASVPVTPAPIVASPVTPAMAAPAAVEAIASTPHAVSTPDVAPAVTHPLHAHMHPTHVASPASSEPAPTPEAAPRAHSAIRVLDPWDDP